HSAVNPAVAQSAISCAACHRDGRDDGRTWAGQGALRQTPVLAGRDVAHTAPYGWNGEYPTLEKYIAFTIKQRLHGTGLADHEPADRGARRREPGAAGAVFVRHPEPARARPLGAVPARRLGEDAGRGVHAARESHGARRTADERRARLARGVPRHALVVPAHA